MFLAPLMMATSSPSSDIDCENGMENHVSAGTAKDYPARVTAQLDLLEKCFGPTRNTTRIEYIVEDGKPLVRAARNARTFEETKDRLIVYIDKRETKFTVSMIFARTDKHASICWLSTPMWNPQFVDLQVSSCLKRM